jgi:hypothetical protein
MKEEGVLGFWGSGSNLLDTSGMGDNQGFQILDGQGGSKGHFNLSLDH